jgi:hypothetical protein
MELRF